MAERGERQRLVLGLVYRRGSITSRDLVEDSGLTPGGAATELIRYQRQGLLHRDREPGPGPPVYRYRLTRSGLNKALWWIAEWQRRHPPGQAHLPGLEPEEPPERIRPVLREERIRPNLRDSEKL